MNILSMAAPFIGGAFSAIVLLYLFVGLIAVLLESLPEVSSRMLLLGLIACIPTNSGRPRKVSSIHS